MKLAILAKDGINLDVLLNQKSTTMDLRSKPQYKQPIEDPTKATEREGKSRNAQLKLSWELECQKIMDAGILCWDLCDQKSVSLLYLSIVTEGRRILNRKESHAVTSELTTIELWTISDNDNQGYFYHKYVRHRNTTSFAPRINGTKTGTTNGNQNGSGHFLS